ncbi:MAG: hypothetical protein RIC55_13045 [Pirellulaceae bacterium]
MTRLPRAIALSLLALHLLLGVAELRAQSFAGGREGLLVLRSRDVLSGRISRSGDRYTVATPDGGEIGLPVSLVDFEARDLGEAYARLSARVDASSAAQQLDIADWCLRQKLYREAADRLLAATVIDPKHPGIRRVETSIFLATHPAEAAPTTTGQSDPTPAATTQHASVQRALDSLPPGAIESFTSTVQPLILNRCAGCHRPGSQAPFYLLRPPRGSSPPRSFTEHNLSSVMRLIDRDRPAESPLLTTPRRPHGGVEAIYSTLDAEELDKIAGWIVSLVSPTTAIAQGAPMQREAVLWQPGAMLRQLATEQKNAPPEADTSSGPGDDAAPMESTPMESAPVESGDPFDPEIFNRRYFPK